MKRPYKENLHRLQHGTGASVPRQPTTRFRVDEAQLDHFLQFITSPRHCSRLAFWPEESTTLKWQCSGSAKCHSSSYTGANNYKQFCKEVGFIPFSQRTMLRISARSATVRKSLQGLDYIAADGALAFDELANLLNQYSYLVPFETLERWQGTLKNTKLYLRETSK